MHRFEQAVRYLLALALGVFGADKFLAFLPKPDPPAQAQAYLGALAEIGFVFPAVGVVFLAAALAFAARRVVLGVVLVVPVLVNIMGYHLQLDPDGIAGGAVLSALTMVVAVLNAPRFSVLFETSRPA